MKVTLTEEEVRSALVDAAIEKVSGVVQFTLENCYFDINDSGNNEVDLGTIEFVCCED